MPEVPPFYEATEDLYIYNPESGVMPAAAFRKGDRVTPDLVEPNGWAGKVRVPDMFASPPPAPAPVPAIKAASPAAGRE